MKEALKLALEALWTTANPKAEEAITAIKAALAQPAQEPVAWMREDATLRFAEGKVFAVGQPFYTTPPAAQPASVPLTLWTEAQHERAYRNSPELHKDVKSLAAFKRVAKEVAAMYGITKGQQ
jgi:acyl-CoA synthetase (NDP forming)